MDEIRYHLNCERCDDLYWSSEAFPNPQLCARCRDEDKKEKRIAELEADSAALQKVCEKVAADLLRANCPECGNYEAQEAAVVLRAACRHGEGRVMPRPELGEVTRLKVELARQVLAEGCGRAREVEYPEEVFEKLQALPDKTPDDDYPCPDGTHHNIRTMIQGVEVVQCECGERGPSILLPDTSPCCTNVSGHWYEQEEPWKCRCGKTWVERAPELEDAWFKKVECTYPDCDGSYSSPWLDRTITTDEDENEIEGMGYVCSKCGRRV